MKRHRIANYIVLALFDVVLITIYLLMGSFFASIEFIRDIEPFLSIFIIISHLLFLVVNIFMYKKEINCIISTSIVSCILVLIGGIFLLITITNTYFQGDIWGPSFALSMIAAALILIFVPLVVASGGYHLFILFKQLFSIKK